MKNKYVWENGDIKFLDETEVEKDVITFSAKSKNFDILSELGVDDYDDIDIENSEHIAKKIFDILKNKGVNDNNIGEIFSNFFKYCNDNLPKGEKLTKQLYYCTKVQLVNMISDFTDYNFSDEDLNQIFDN